MLNRARFDTTHCSAAMTVDTSVAPSQPATLTDTRLVSGAAPSNASSVVTPPPAMTPAMCVPWPKWSMPSRSLVRSTRASRRAPRFGFGVTPVSIDATVTPSPWYLFGTRSRPIARCHVASGGSAS